MILRSLQFFRSRRVNSQVEKRQGATAVEMALLVGPFFLLIVGITEFCLILTAQQLLENATFNTSRLAKTGYIANGQTQSQTVTQILTNELSGFGALIDTSKVTMTETAYSDFAVIGTGGTTGMGTQQQIVVYTVTYPWTLFTPLMGSIIGTYDTGTQSWVVYLSARIVARNEPYG